MSRDFSETKSHFRGQIGDKRALGDFLGIFFAKRDKFFEKSMATHTQIHTPRNTL